MKIAIIEMKNFLLLWGSTEALNLLKEELANLKSIEIIQLEKKYENRMKKN